MGQEEVELGVAKSGPEGEGEGSPPSKPGNQPRPQSTVTGYGWVEVVNAAREYHRWMEAAEQLTGELAEARTEIVHMRERIVELEAELVRKCAELATARRVLDAARELVAAWRRGDITVDGLALATAVAAHATGHPAEPALSPSRVLTQDQVNGIMDDERLRPPGCAPGCDYPVTGYHAKRYGEVLCNNLEPGK